MTAPQEGAAQGLSEQEAEIYRLTVVNRMSQRAIAERLDMTQQRVSQVLANARAKLPPVDLDAIRRESLEMHLNIQREALLLAGMPGAPVTAGRDGDLVLDPETGKHVRDYSLRLAAFEAARKSDIEIRKLYGLDSPTKVEQSGSVRYEVLGVNTELLS